MNTSTVETVRSPADKVKLAAAIAISLAALVGYYALDRKGLWFQLGVLFGGFALGLALFFISDVGKQFVAYAKDSVKEVKKVVWPTRQETTQMTLYVFVFVLVMALFLWLTDKSLEWILYSLILGWKH
jgi:preprotein translocase subunit SecE